MLQVDAGTGAATTIIRTKDRRGIDVAADGTIYVVEAGKKRIGRFRAGWVPWAVNPRLAQVRLPCCG